MTEARARIACLAALRADLLRGEFGTLETHLRHLESLEGALSESTGSQQELAELREEAMRVSNVLTSAGAGVRAALRRLRDATSPPATYGVDGRRTVLGGEPSAQGSRA